MSMTTTELDRLEALVARLERAGGRSLGPSQRVATNPDGTPGNVVPGELIESAWGNAVADTLNVGHGFFGVNNQMAIGGSAGFWFNWNVINRDTDGYWANGVLAIPPNLGGLYVITLSVTVSAMVKISGYIATTVGASPANYGWASVDYGTLASASVCMVLTPGSSVAVTGFNYGAAIDIFATLELHRAAVFN